MDVNAPEFKLPYQELISDNQPVGESSNINHSSGGFIPQQYGYVPGGSEYSAPNQDYALLSTVIADSGSNARSQLGVSTLAFDNQEELLWMGNTGGHVTSYYTYELQKYTSFQVHNVNDIRYLMTGSFGLLSLTQNTLRLSIRRGLTCFTHSSELLKDMQCMTTLPSDLILLGGHQNKLIEFDLERGKQVRVTDTDDQGCVIMRQHPKFVCCGDVAGKISIRDPSTLNVVKKFNTHSVTLSDFDVHGNYLVTCGYSNRHVYTPDRLLMLYDLRAMRALPPIQMMFSPYLLRFVPAFSSKFFVVSQTGQYQMMDTSGSLTPPPFINNIDLTPEATITAFDVSTSCQCLAFSDTSGCIYLCGANNEVVFNNFSHPTEFADPAAPLPHIPFDDPMVPLFTIPMDTSYILNGEKLLSDWPPELCKKVYRVPKPIPAQILNSMRMVGSIGYAMDPSAITGNGNKRKNRNRQQYMSVDGLRIRTGIESEFKRC